MNWSGIPSYLNASRVVWNNTLGEVAGFMRNYKNFYQVIVAGAGHM